MSNDHSAYLSCVVICGILLHLQPGCRGLDRHEGVAPEKWVEARVSMPPLPRAPKDAPYLTTFVVTRLGVLTSTARSMSTSQPSTVTVELTADDLRDLQSMLNAAPKLPTLVPFDSPMARLTIYSGDGVAEEYAAPLADSKAFPNRVVAWLHAKVERIRGGRDRDAH